MLRDAGGFAMTLALASRGAVPAFVRISDMAKMKTKRAAAKRFAFTGTGKVKLNAANHRHNMTHKSQNVKVAQRKTSIARKGDAALVRLMLPYGG